MEALCNKKSRDRPRKPANFVCDCLITGKTRVKWRGFSNQLKEGIAVMSGVSVNYDDIFRRWAEQGDAAAQYLLGLIYDKGDGVARDYAEAVKWYRRAAEQGVAVAQYNLGVSYARGEGVASDGREAYIWFSLAEANGDKDAVGFRETVASRLSPADLSAAQQEVSRRQAKIQANLPIQW